MMDLKWCTTPECTRLTTVYLCTECIAEFAELLKDVEPIVRLIDGAIDRTSVTRAPGSGSSGHHGSKPAINIDALLLKAWLCQLPGNAMDAAHEMPDAGQHLYMAREWVPRGRELVWGQEDRRVYGRCEEPIDDPEFLLEQQLGDAEAIEEGNLCQGELVVVQGEPSVRCPECGAVHQVSDLLDRLHRRARGEPMPPRAVREYLHRKAKVLIPKKDLENWVHRGDLSYVLDRVTTTSKAQRLYYPGDVLNVYEGKRARRRNAA